MKKELNQLKLSNIIIPKNLLMTFNGKDTIGDLYTYNTKCKFVIYYDSSECNACSMSKIQNWETILRKFKDDISFFIIFHPSNSEIQKLNIALMSYPIDYPILIDQNGDFEKLNPHLPKNKAMHTFLLDENNKVILVGNPLYNKEIEKLFYNKTQELLAK